jgi:hypothetical protein
LLLILLYFVENGPQSTVQEQAPRSRIRKERRHAAKKKLKMKVNFTVEQAKKANSRSVSIALLFL